MKKVLFPSTSRCLPFAPSIQAHNRGGESTGGHYYFDNGPGAKWRGTLEIVAAGLNAACRLRAFFHSLRGKSGTLLLPLPVDYAQTASVCTAANGLAQYSDCTTHTDGTTYTDRKSNNLVGAPQAFGFTTAAASANATSLVINSELAASLHCVLGGFAFVGPTDGGQLLRITAISGSTLTVRPRLRSAWPLGSTISLGRVMAPWRLDQETPAVPMTGERMQPMSVQIQEAY